VSNRCCKEELKTYFMYNAIFSVSLKVFDIIKKKYIFTILSVTIDGVSNGNWIY
jgi:hypothetical protein